MTGPGPGGSQDLSVYAGAEDRPIFIGACPRSGTTLLRSMLNTHPGIAIPRETRFLPFVWESRGRWGDLETPAGRERLANLIAEPWTRANRFEMPMAELHRRLLAAPPTLGSVLGTCFAAYAESTGKQRWGDKRPMYSRYLDSIFSLFPDTQFINMIRDPRASAASMRKLGWFDGELAPAVELWVRSLRAVEPWRKQLRSDQYFDVRYEDLVADPETALGKLAAFLGLSPDSVAVMLTYHEHVDETSKTYHPRLSEPVNDDAVEAWREHLDPDEVALVEHVSGPYLERFGYAATTSARPSSALLAEYRATRRKVAKQRRRVEVKELRSMAINRQPMAARLTSGQREIDKPPSMPSFPKRQIGKPR